MRVERAGFSRPVRDLKCFGLEPGTEVTGLLSDVPSPRDKERANGGKMIRAGQGRLQPLGGRKCVVS